MLENLDKPLCYNSLNPFLYFAFLFQPPEGIDLQFEKLLHGIWDSRQYP